MTLFDRDALLGSIDQTLASLRATLAARADPEQPDAGRAVVAGRAAAELANLPEAPDEWPDVPGTVFESIRRAKRSAREGDIDGAHRSLVRARESLGGPSA